MNWVYIPSNILTSNSAAERAKDPADNLRMFGKKLEEIVAIETK